MWIGEGLMWIGEGQLGKWGGVLCKIVRGTSLLGEGNPICYPNNRVMGTGINLDFLSKIDLIFVTLNSSSTLKNTENGKKHR